MNEGLVKSCAVCGRKIEWRKKWEKDWASVRYCSERCRGRRSSVKKEGALFEAAILTLLSGRANGYSVREEDALPTGREADEEGREKVREAARRLAGEGKIEILQGGRRVSPFAFSGAIELRLPRR